MRREQEPLAVGQPLGVEVGLSALDHPFCGVVSHRRSKVLPCDSVERTQHSLEGPDPGAPKRDDPVILRHAFREPVEPFVFGPIQSTGIPRVEQLVSKAVGHIRRVCRITRQLQHHPLRPGFALPLSGGFVGREQEHQMA